MRPYGVRGKFIRIKRMSVYRTKWQRMPKADRVRWWRSSRHTERQAAQNEIRKETR